MCRMPVRPLLLQRMPGHGPEGSTQSRMQDCRSQAHYWSAEVPPRYDDPHVRCHCSSCEGTRKRHRSGESFLLWPTREHGQGFGRHGEFDGRVTAAQGSL
ncbi:hypothetical protein RvY_06049-2 [Ramazzottius varieornatus]|uniref:Uncharacterized protein n=1 Tax=Ramazzottius varieornatus TaxID=947166 RepID=A0A1D1V6V5_RAMVA|nr:hypothetical protein RvY_06049-2 [Ramazzottius varieornatus]